MIIIIMRFVVFACACICMYYNELEHFVEQVKCDSQRQPLSTLLSQQCLARPALALAHLTLWLGHWQSVSLRLVVCLVTILPICRSL